MYKNYVSGTDYAVFWSVGHGLHGTQHLPKDTTLL